MAQLILDETGEPIPAPDAQTWAWWWMHADRRIANDRIGAFRVVTAFVGNPGGDGPLFETVVLGGEHRRFHRRYRTRREALAGHVDVLLKLRQA